MIMTENMIEILEVQEFEFEASHQNDVSHLSGLINYLDDGIEKQLNFRIKSLEKLNVVFRNLNPNLFIVEFEGYSPLKGREYSNRRLSLREFLTNVQACSYDSNIKANYETENGYECLPYVYSMIEALKEVITEETVEV